MYKLLIISLAFFTITATADVEIEDARTGLKASVNNDGVYTLSWAKEGWSFQGQVKTNDAMPYVIQGTHHDEIHFAGAYTIRLYPERLSFHMSRRGQAHALRFPDFTRFPHLSHALSFQKKQFSPITFSIQGDAPWLFFNDRRASFLLSPANHFMVSNNFREDGHLAAGLEPSIDDPETVEISTVLSFGSGINQAFENWGNLLTDLSAKSRPNGSADTLLAKLSYWTDNRAAYYYNAVESLGYTRTLTAIRDEFNHLGFPIGLLQLDSWWYLKGGNPSQSPPLAPSWKASNNYQHGIYLYELPSDLNAGGLEGMQKNLDLPLAVHSRWIDATSPYRQSHEFSRNVPMDRSYWQQTMERLKQARVEVFEQDWLDDYALPRLDRLHDADRFLDSMAEEARTRGIHLQYCMPLPRHFLQSTKYPNAMTIRPSADGFDRTRWSEFLFGSRLARAVGLWPFTDVFFSRDIKNLLLATLSGGPVGVGDRLTADSNPNQDSDKEWCTKENCASLNAVALGHAILSNGTVVKPNRALLPLDQSYLPGRPMLAAAYSWLKNNPNPAAAYLFAYKEEGSTANHFNLSAEELGFRGPIYVYNYFTGQGQSIGVGQRFSAPLSIEGDYWIITPLTASGVALLGDLNFFASLGEARVEVEEIREQHIRFRLHALPTEKAVSIWLRSPTSPRVAVGDGRAVEPVREGALGLWRVNVPANSGAPLEVEISGSGGRAEH